MMNRRTLSLGEKQKNSTAENNVEFMPKKTLKSLIDQILEFILGGGSKAQYQQIQKNAKSLGVSEKDIDMFMKQNGVEVSNPQAQPNALKQIQISKPNNREQKLDLSEISQIGKGLVGLEISNANPHHISAPTAGNKINSYVQQR